MRALYLIRHAEPAITGVLLGGCDPGLSGAGRAAAAVLAVDAAVVYASGMRRARETAAAFAAQTPVVVLPELNEISYGEWDGRTWAAIESGAPALAAAKLDDWTGVTPPGGEPWPVFERRVRRALDRVMSGPWPAAIVAHSAVNAAIAAMVLGTSATDFSQDYCEVTRIDL